MLGSLLALLLARGLIAAFRGKGLVPEALTADPAFLLSVSVAAALTVLLATRLGLPVSTTHALIRGLVGAARWQPTAISISRASARRSCSHCCSVRSSPSA